MNLFLLAFLFIWSPNNPEILNYYPSYTSAREAARSQNKEMVVFFTKKTCNPCKSQWTSFEKDAAATQKYVSTWVDAEDFDGAVLFEIYQMTDVPSWVILMSDGKIKEKWEGGWKDASGNPAPVIREVTKTPVFKPYTPPKNTTAQPAPENAFAPYSQNKSADSVSPSTVTKTETNATGFVIQAGYFGSEANALKLVSDLKGKGFENYSIKTAELNGSKFYRVISKVYSSENEANQEVQSLSGAGIKAAVKKVSEI